jgi:poly(3-hydroxyalkanoate) synthetase
LGQKREGPPERTGPGADWLHGAMLWPYTATKLAMDACLWWTESLGSAEPSDGTALTWKTPNKVALELPTLRLRDFSRRRTGPPALICAPYALHGALIADLAPGHSIVEALRRGGLERLYVTDWRSASSEMRFLSIDHYLADLNVAIDEIGAPVDLIGLCQGGWLSLVYAARFPQKVRRLVLVGVPVDVSVESELSRTVAGASQAAFVALVNSGGGVVRGDHMLRFWSASPDVEVVLQRDLSRDAAPDKELLDQFARWYAVTLDLPGTFYLQTVHWIFRENRLARGCFVALGREIHLEQLRTPVFLLAGADDEIVPVEQAMAAASLLGTPATSIESAIIPSTHLGLFIGRRTLATSWPRIAAWLKRDESGKRPRDVASA